MVDLHTHSVFSDGTATPEELVAAAIEQDGIIALTDHNTVKGLPRLLKARGNRGVAATGIEFSTALNGSSFHILGLFIAENTFEEVENKASVYLASKAQSNYLLAENLKKAGYDIDYSEVEALCPEGNINRSAFASVLVKKGYAESNKSAIATLLSEEAGCYIPPERPDSCDIIKFIRSIDAVPVLAHPCIGHSYDELRDSVALMKEAGLVGIETMHSEYNRGQEFAATMLADKFDLFPSGGSDYHGERKPDIELFTGKGNLNVPEKYFLDLLQFNLKHRKDIVL